MHFVLPVEFSDPGLPKFCLLKRFIVTQRVSLRISGLGCIVEFFVVAQKRYTSITFRLGDY